MSFEGITFFQSFDLRNGSILPGFGSLDNLTDRAEQIFAGQVAGKSVLDVGAWDGFFSFEAERYGASRVLATDHFCWSGPGWGTKAGFDAMHRHYDSNVESLDIDVPDLSPERLGTFDMVLFLGVLYHLKDPYRGLEMAAAMCSEQLIIETVGAMLDEEQPVMRFFLGAELNGDASNFWAPNRSCLRNMLLDIGFKHIDFLKQTDGPDRLLVRATR